jgi:hypothetical protein
MSWADATFKAQGRFVRHAFPRKSNKCKRCGVRRRWHTSGWTWQSQSGDYSHSNPPCAFKPVRP